MSAALGYAFAGCALVLLGLGGTLWHRHLLRRLLAFNILTSGVFLLLVALSQRDGVVDPLPQALVLTGIVVAIAATAIVLLLLRRWYQLSGRAELQRAETLSDGSPRT